MAPEQVGMLTVLDLSFRNGDLVSKTERYMALTNESLTESARKLRVDWTAIEMPRGGEYFPVGDGVAYVNAADIPLLDEKEGEELLQETSRHRYRWENWVPLGLGRAMFILILPQGYKYSRIEPEPTRLRAKTFEDRLVLLVWAKADELIDSREPDRIEIQVEIEALEDDLRSEARRINEDAKSAQPGTPEYVLPDVAVEEPPSSNLDIGFVVALPEEFNIIYPQITYEALTDDRINQTFYLFERSGYRCVAIVAGDVGTTDAAVASVELMQQFNPTTMVSIGIAGSLEEEVKVGDVVAAVEAIDYIHAAKAITAREPGSGIEVGSGTELVTSGKPFSASPAYIDRVRALGFAHEEAMEEWRTSCGRKCEELIEETKRNELIREGLIREQPQLHAGRIATSPWVVADERFVTWLKRLDRKFLAVEMEAAAVMNVARRRSAYILTIKGVSDYSDERKTKFDTIGGGALRDYAMSNAVALLWTLMDYGLIQRSVEEKPRDSSIPISRGIESRRQEMEDIQHNTLIDELMDYLVSQITEEQLRERERYHIVRVRARGRTLQVLRELDKSRKKDLLQVLHEAHLIKKEDPEGNYEYPVVGLSGAELSNANLRGIILENSALSGAILENADLRESKLKGIDLGGAFLSGADLSGADLRGADFANASLEPKRNPWGEKLKGANLSGADLEDAMLSGADLSDVSPRGANLAKAFLEQNRDRGLEEADLSGADLTGAILAEAKVSDEQLDVCKSLKGATMPDGSKHE